MRLISGCEISSTIMRLGSCLEATWEHNATGHFAGVVVRWHADESNNREQSDSVVLTIEGEQIGDTACAFEKRTPRLAIASMLGVTLETMWPSRRKR